MFSIRFLNVVLSLDLGYIFLLLCNNQLDFGSVHPDDRYWRKMVYRICPQKSVD